MKAIIKKNFDLEDLVRFGFREDINLKNNTKVYLREIKSPVHLVVNTKTREIRVITPMGAAAFIESHKDKFEDLIKAEIVEFI